MTTGLKIGIGAGLGLGAVGATAGVSYLVSQPKNLKEDLEKSGIKLLDTKSDTDKAHWATLAKEHAKVEPAEKVTKINELSITDSDQDPHPGIDQLKKVCENLFEKTKEDKNYETAKKDATNWCSKASPLLSKA